MSSGELDDVQDCGCYQKNVVDGLNVVAHVIYKCERHRTSEKLDAMGEQLQELFQRAQRISAMGMGLAERLEALAARGDNIIDVDEITVRTSDLREMAITARELAREIGTV